MYGSSSIIAQRWICLQKIAMRWKKGTAWNFLPNDKWNLEANTGLLIEAFFSLRSSHSLSPIIFCSQMEQLHCSLPDLCLLCLLAASCKMAKKSLLYYHHHYYLVQWCFLQPLPYTALQKILYLSVMISAFQDQKSSIIVRKKCFDLLETFEMKGRTGTNSGQVYWKLQRIQSESGPQ